MQGMRYASVDERLIKERSLPIRSSFEDGHNNGNAVVMDHAELPSTDAVEVHVDS